MNAPTSTEVETAAPQEPDRMKVEGVGRDEPTKLIVRRRQSMRIKVAFVAMALIASLAAVVISQAAVVCLSTFATLLT